MPTLTTDPALLELMGMMDKIQKNLEAIDPSATQIDWLNHLSALSKALAGTTASLSTLRNLVLADALAEGLEGIDAGADEDAPAYQRAVLYALAESTEFSVLFSEWPAEFAKLQKVATAKTTTPSEATDAARALVSKLENYLKEPKIDGLVGNPWGVKLVEPVQSAVSALKTKLS